MQSITMTADMTATQLFNLCRDHGISFVGFRAKIAKSKYIAAIAEYNAALEIAITADDIAPVQATEITGNTIAQALIDNVLLAATIAFMSGQWVRRYRIHHYLLGAFIVAASLAYAIGYHAADYFQSIVADDRPSLQLLSDALVTLPVIQSTIGTILLYSAVILLAGAMAAYDAILWTDWIGLAVNITMRGIRIKRSVTHAGNVWADSTGANG